jgi:predicted outer membrane protein
MAIDEDAVAVLAAKYAVMRQVADERTWRVYLGSEARALGYGGIAVVARAAGVSETMVAAGVAEIEAGSLARCRRGGRAAGGRRRRTPSRG